MIEKQQRRVWKALLAVTLVIGLLLLAAHPSDNASAVCFILLPVFLFALVDVPRSLWPSVEVAVTVRHQLLQNAFLFQRPPPFA